MNESTPIAADRLRQNWQQAFERAVAYAEALGVGAGERERLATAAVEAASQAPVWPAGATAVSECLRALRTLVQAEVPQPAHLHAADEDPFVGWRLNAFFAHSLAAVSPQPLFSSMPPLARRSMVPERVERRVFKRWLNRLQGISSESTRRGTALRQQRRHWKWTAIAARRRLLLAVLVLLPSIVASGFMVNVLPHQGRTWLEVAITLFFGALFGWISIGFWTATIGFFLLARGHDRFAITNLADDDPSNFRPAGRTAIVMPICEEPVARVFAGLKAIYASLERTGAIEHFDFFIMSDTADPSRAADEELAWAMWCRDIGRLDRIFYRRRRVRLKRKSGNVADFCRRWGSQYAYMIMLDADSIMAGETLVKLVAMMERQSDAGIIQTAPRAVNRMSLQARAQQFAGRVYGPMFAAGLHYWQLGDGQYWGHNAIIRVKPFMDHCGLPRLSGKPPFGGDILSHDFVEAALMGRAGWTLWLAYDLGGSYEEVPSTLLEEMGRDRRWCQGNLQHLRLLRSEGLFGAHRALFINGVLSYVSAFLWFCFLGLSTAEAIIDALTEPDYFPHGASLFPEWPIWRPDWALSLMAVTAAILFLPKVLSLALIVFKNRQASQFGGLARLSLSAFLELILSSLLAPIRMVFHSRFVVTNLLGRTVTWTSQSRGDAETSWPVAMRQHGFDTVFASAWGLSLYWLNPDYFWWVTPIIGALFVSIPLSVLGSRGWLGEWIRQRRLFLIPEESMPPRELQELVALESASMSGTEDGWVNALVEPRRNAVHRALARGRRRVGASIAASRREFVDLGLKLGPNALDAPKRRVLWRDPLLVDAVHQGIWESPKDASFAQWSDDAAPETHD